MSVGQYFRCTYNKFSENFGVNVLDQPSGSEDDIFGADIFTSVS